MCNNVRNENHVIGINNQIIISLIKYVILKCFLGKLEKLFLYVRKTFDLRSSSI